jgi:hypothetical protein
MAMARIRTQNSQTSEHKGHRGEQGFALVSLLALVPVIATLFLCVAVALYAIKKKALAQAYCIRGGVRVQLELRRTLDALLKLNKPAARLRLRRLAADRKLASAAASANPYAIAAAKAVQTAVIMEQTAFRARQEALLKEAGRQRLEGWRELNSSVRGTAVDSAGSRTFYSRPLAVEAVPASSLTPDFVPFPGFAQAQQHRFDFRVSLIPGMASRLIIPAATQTTACSVTLTGKENAWTIRIVADKPLSSWW